MIKYAYSTEAAIVKRLAQILKQVQAKRPPNLPPLPVGMLATVVTGGTYLIAAMIDHAKANPQEDGCDIKRLAPYLAIFAADIAATGQAAIDFGASLEFETPAETAANEEPALKLLKAIFGPTVTVVGLDDKPAPADEPEVKAAKTRRRTESGDTIN